MAMRWRKVCACCEPGVAEESWRRQYAKAPAKSSFRKASMPRMLITANSFGFILSASSMVFCTRGLICEPACMYCDCAN